MIAALEPQSIRVPRSISWRNTSPHWRERLSLVETLLDPGTIRIFEKIGVREGWHRLEVAGGGGSIANGCAGKWAAVVTSSRPILSRAFLRLSTRPTWKSGATTF